MVAALRRAAADDLSCDDLTDLLKVAFCHRNQIDAALTSVIGALDQAAEQAPDGEATMALSSATWLSHNLHISSSAAYAQVQLARRLPSLPDTAGAFERGELSAQHVSVVARSVDAVTRGGGPPGHAEALMLEEARQREPRDLLRYGLSLVHQLAPEEMLAEEERRRRRRHIQLSEVFDGGYEIAGHLDPVGGATLKTAIQGLLGPRAKDDERTPGQRRADALVEIATRVLDQGDLPTRGGQRPHITITATLDTLCGNPGAPAALLDWAFPISGRELRRIAKDAEITPILVSSKSDPLHVGRKYRTATPKMNRALDERDRGCLLPGCDRPPEMCQRHHEVDWVAGGETDVDRMLLLCGPHHRLLSRGWRLERLPDGGAVVHPPPRPGGVEALAIHDPPSRMRE